MILVPLGLLAGLPTAQIEAVLLHEIAHIRRHDYLLNLVQSVIEGLLFYHPAVWWVSHRIRTEREFCCDDLVVAATGDAPSYARALSALEHGRAVAHQAALAATSGCLILRVRRLLGGSVAGHSLAGPVVGLLLLATCAALVAWQPEPAPAPAPAPAPQPEPAPQPQQQPAETRQPNTPGPYQRWLDTEVAYIIAPEEREVFLRLQTDDERQMFIEQFWLRRDPTPGTPENELREEHYGRIAWANDRFRFGQTAGWQTDRGVFYIAFGAPDEVVREKTPWPWEQWRYRYIEGLGKDVIATFDDARETGEFGLTRINGPLGDPDAMKRLRPLLEKTPRRR